jgi:uncharacterized protein YggE
MRKKISIISLLMILAVLVSACGTALAQAPTPEPAKRTISVNGSAQATLTPDIAYMTIGVHTENAEAKKAVTDNTSGAEKVIAALKSMGIDAKDIRTANFNIYPSQEFTPEGQLKSTKYVVDNSVFVTVRDLSKVGDVLSAAIGAGANNVSGIQFDVADKNAALADARKQAVDNAHALADELAKAAGVTLGQVQSITFFGSSVPPMPVFEGKGGGAADQAIASVPISAGQLTVSVDVSIVFEIQ